MSKNGTLNVMACGACAVIMDENGQTTTSIDLIVDGVKRLLARLGRNAPAKRAAAAASR